MIFDSVPKRVGVTDSDLRLMLRRLGQRAEVDHCNPHTFRRTFALWSLQAGMSIYALQRIIGHSDLSILRRYLALTERAMSTIHPVRTLSKRESRLLSAFAAAGQSVFITGILNHPQRSEQRPASPN